MNRNYISPEFEYKKVFGTLKMTEDVSFFSSKMLEIEDSLNVLSDNLIYYQLDTNEQLDEDTEKSLPEIIYDATVDKKSNHTIMLDLNQTAQQKLDKARWIIEIDLKKILRNYIFALLKKNRTFNGVRNTMVISNNVNTSITEYIEKNIISRYKFSKIDLYNFPIDLGAEGILQYNNQYDQFIESDGNKITDFESVTKADGSSVKISFNQKRRAQDFAFRYYFNLYFEKL
jgi:hypothetical protein